MSRNDESSSGSSDFFSPISISFFQNRGNLVDSVERNPVQDSSWIGARLSPIQSFDREQDEDDEDEIEDQRKRRMQNRLDNAPFVTERSKLLGTKGQSRGSLTRTGSLSKIHPLWESPMPNPRRSFSMSPLSYVSVGRVVCIMSGVNLFCMAIFDTLETYRLYRTGRSDVGRFHLWSIPFFVPPLSTLRMFGAMAPDYMTSWRSRYTWSVITSFFVSTSLVEWMLIACAWKIVRISSRQQQRPTQFGGIFLASCVTGQLWTWVYDGTEGRTVGAVAWGTCGVITAAGMSRPGFRFELYIVGVLLLLLALFQRPSTSVWGSTAGAFLGWALGAAGCERADLKDHPSSQTFTRIATLTGTVLAVGIIGSPVLSLAFPDTSSITSF